MLGKVGDAAGGDVDDVLDAGALGLPEEHRWACTR